MTEPIFKSAPIQKDRQLGYLMDVGARGLAQALEARFTTLQKRYPNLAGLDIAITECQLKDAKLKQNIDKVLYSTAAHAALGLDGDNLIIARVEDGEPVVTIVTAEQYEKLMKEDES